MLTDNEKKEIQHLKNDPLVKLAQASLSKKTDPEKKKLYHLRWLKKQGEKIVKESQEV